jgi:hypothetical protein
MNHHLWQALAALVGEALAQRWLASNTNRPQQPIANEDTNEPVSAANSQKPPPENQDERDSR